MQALPPSNAQLLGNHLRRIPDATAPQTTQEDPRKPFPRINAIAVPNGLRTHPSFHKWLEHNASLDNKWKLTPEKYLQPGFSLQDHFAEFSTLIHQSKSKSTMARTSAAHLAVSSISALLYGCLHAIDPKFYLISFAVIPIFQHLVHSVVSNPSSLKQSPHKQDLVISMLGILTSYATMKAVIAGHHPEVFAAIAGFLGLALFTTTYLMQSQNAETDRKVLENDIHGLQGINERLSFESIMGWLHDHPETAKKLALETMPVQFSTEVYAKLETTTLSAKTELDALTESARVLSSPDSALAALMNVNPEQAHKTRRELDSKIKKLALQIELMEDLIRLPSIISEIQDKVIQRNHDKLSLDEIRWLLLAPHADAVALKQINKVLELLGEKPEGPLEIKETTEAPPPQIKEKQKNTPRQRPIAQKI
ncbi:MAG: hypothetical protein H7A33_07940 [Deltaproteobacteria bacterium]|nr:hypothetical protein [Deltaproteobacteria bacterium]